MYDIFWKKCICSIVYIIWNLELWDNNIIVLEFKGIVVIYLKGECIFNIVIFFFLLLKENILYFYYLIRVCKYMFIYIFISYIYIFFLV